MAAQTQQRRTRTTSVSPEPDAALAPTQRYGNAAAQEGLTPGASADAGLADYETALGHFLGAELHGAVHGALTFDKLQGYAATAIEAAVQQAVARFGGIKGIQSDPAALDGLVGILGDLLQGQADAWLAEDGAALQAQLSGWAGAHPRTVAGVALLAAAGAVLADMKLPALHHAFGLGAGTKLETEAALGGLRSLALERLRARLSHEAGPLVAAIELTRTAAGVEGSADLKVTGEGKELTANGTFDGDGLKVVGVAGVLETGAGKLSGSVKSERGGDGAQAALSLERADGSRTHTTDFTFDSGSGVMTLGHHAVSELSADTQLDVSGKAGSDGSANGHLGATHKGKHTETTASADYTRGAYGMTEEQKLQFGAHYTRADLEAQLDATLQRTDGVGRAAVNASVKRDLGGGRRAGGHVNTSFTTDETLLELGAYYGFSDPASFRAWLVEYAYASKADDHQLKGMLQEKLGDIQVRYQGDMKWGGSGRSLDLSAHAAWHTDTDTALVAGVNYRRDFEANTGGVRPEIGVQHKGVQVLFGYDTGEKAATVRLGIPF